jgi:PncC family amidohydrolase
MTSQITREVAAEVLDALRGQGLTLGTAESLTGGGLGELVTSVPGSSSVYVGGVVSYASRVKIEVLGVPREVVEGDGVVSAACARAMAVGVRAVVGADVGVSTTGVAGPEEQEGRPVGLVYIAVADAAGAAVRELRLEGDRAAVRAATARGALLLLKDRILGVDPRTP